MQSASSREEISNNDVRRVASSTRSRNGEGFTSFIWTLFNRVQRRSNNKALRPPASICSIAPRSSTSTRRRFNASIPRRNSSRALPRTRRPEQRTTATSCWHSTWYRSSILLFITQPPGEKFPIIAQILRRSQGEKVINRKDTENRCQVSGLVDC